MSGFAHVSGPHGAASGDDPLHDPTLRRQLEHNDGFVFDSKTGTGWASRAIVRNGNHVADLYVALELKPLAGGTKGASPEPCWLQRYWQDWVLPDSDSLIVHRMVRPVRLLTDRLRRAQAGDFDRVPPGMLPPPSSEYGRLLRGYNDLVDALAERDALASRLAERERESVLGRLAATLAHEVRNPLGGMATALDTVRKFGDNRDVRAQGLDLIERGLWSIRDVVSSVLAFHRVPADGRKLTAGDLEDLRTLIAPEAARRRPGPVLAQRHRWCRRRQCHRNSPDCVEPAAERVRGFAVRRPCRLCGNACERRRRGSAGTAAGSGRCRPGAAAFDHRGFDRVGHHGSQ